MDTNIATGLENIIGTNSTTKTSTMKSVGKDEFMKLLLAQLKNQDPLKPMDGTDFAVQLAQFTSLEQLSSLNSEMKAQSVNQMTVGYAQSVSMIGKEAVAGSGNGITANGRTVDLNYSLARDAQRVIINILDKDGRIVNTLENTYQKAGMNKAAWDCSNAEKGDYTFQVTATDLLGSPVAASTMTSGVVTAVHFRNNQILATINGQEVPLNKIVEIKTADNA